MIATYNGYLVILSIVIAIVASYAALDVSERITLERQRLIWLVGGAVAMGIGIWAMHFIAMIAYSLPVAITYNSLTVLVSLLISVLTSFLALSIASRSSASRRLLVPGGAVTGLGYITMHYYGMTALDVSVVKFYDVRLVSLSIAIAFGAATVGLWLISQTQANQTLRPSHKLGSASILGGGLAAMHYTAMAAAHFSPRFSLPLAKVNSSPAMDETFLALSIGLATLVILILALVVSLFDRRINLELAEAEMLRRSEERFRSLVQNSSDIIAVVSKAGAIDYVSPSLERVLGHAPTRWINHNLSDLVHSQDLARTENFLKNVGQLAQDATDVTTEFCVQDSQGNWRVLEVIAHNLSSEPTIAGIVLTCHDITQRKRQEEQLRLLQSVVVQARDAIIITESLFDLPGPRILYVNEAFTQLTGYSAEEAIGQTPRLLQGENTDRTALNQLRAALEQWQPIVVELINYHKDGSEFWVELSIVPVANERGQFTHWVAIQRNISERKRAEIEIRNALERERELRELKSRFISMASHEFRTPLATIMASSDLLKSFGHKLTDEKKLERLNKIQVEVKNMTRLLDDVLLIGKAEAGRVEFNPAFLDLKLLCQDILEEIQLTLSDRHQLTFQAASQAFGDRAFRTYADEKLLRHILTNLLSNAVKYSPSGGKVTLKLRLERTTFKFQIQDQGIGIPPSDQARLFELFHRGSNAGNISGTGLGLAIIKYATDLHGGAIQVTSEVGVGSTFTVGIPRICPTQVQLCEEQ